MIAQIELSPLSTSEMELFDEQWRRADCPEMYKYDDPKGIAYVKDGDFTVAILGGKWNDLYVGVAKRSPRDKMNQKIGRTIAFCRAARKALTRKGIDDEPSV